MYLATLDCATSNPSLSNSPWIRGAPQSGFSMLIRRIKARSSALDLRPPAKRARLPTPVATKAGPMPTDERLGTDDRDDLQHRRKPSIQLDKEQAIAVGEADATSHYNQLISERVVLCLKTAPRLQRRSEQR